MFPQSFVVKRSIFPLLIQTAEAHRKPRWFPVAKSKIYRIPERPVVPPEERLELMRITKNYKTKMRAVRKFFYEDLIRENSTLESSTSEMSQRLEAEEWERCLKLNEQWNDEVASKREKRREQELVKMEERAIALMETRDRELKERIKKASAEIRKQKELSSTFITPDKLEGAIDYALANPVDYNYAIDLHGHQIQGYETPTIPEKEQNSTINNQLT